MTQTRIDEVTMALSRSLHRLSTCLLFLVPSTLARHVYTDSFPDYTEYDAAILDPHTFSGAPYGGFSRASATRLAALPLHLPEVSEDDMPVESLAMRVRDKQGRLFVCRVYHEDELDAASVEESVFDAPRLRAKQETPETRKGFLDEEVRAEMEEKEVNEASGQEHRALEEKIGTEETDERGETMAPATESGDAATSEGTAVPHASSRAADTDSMAVNAKGEFRAIVDKTSLILELEQKLTLSLKGTCSQIHLGWWSYEWCYKSHVSQFHVNINAERGETKVSDVTALGEWQTRVFQPDLEDKPVNQLAEGIPELARVIDSFGKGDTCPETGEPRRAVVQMVCCSPDVMIGRKGRRARTAEDQSTGRPVAAIHNVMEDPNEICSYVLTVCTSLLCHDSEQAELLPLVKEDQAPMKAPTPQSATKEAPPKPKENESVREILDRVLSDECLIGENGGWWSYEFCHGHWIRQYHEALVSQKTTTGAVFTSRVTESEHTLGLYDERTAEFYTKEDEWRHVVNATDVKKAKEGTYFEVEYTNGAVCDDAEVTDSAVVAGGVKGGIARASSVRFYCDDDYSLMVSEDSTCHYIVKVTLPELCSHPLFRVPVMKKQVVKCLPVEEDERFDYQ